MRGGAQTVWAKSEREGRTKVAAAPQRWVTTECSAPCPARSCNKHVSKSAVRLGAARSERLRTSGSVEQFPALALHLIGSRRFCLSWDKCLIRISQLAGVLASKTARLHRSGLLLTRLTKTPPGAYNAPGLARMPPRSMDESK